MLNLILTILFSSLIIVTFKVAGLFKLNENQMIPINYAMAVLCGFLIWDDPISFSFVSSTDWFNIAFLTGSLFTITFFLMSASAAKSGVAITAVASRMSVVFPVLAGFLLYQDQINLLKSIGILLAFASFYLVFKTKEKVNLSIKKIIIPFVLFLGIGINDTLMKYVEHHYLKNDLTVFLTVVFFIAFLLTGIWFIYRMIFKNEKLSGKSILAGILLGALNFGSTYFFMKSMSIFQSSILFPVVNISIVSLTALIGYIVFKEKLSRVNWAGIFLTIIAILLITIA